MRRRRPRRGARAGAHLAPAKQVEGDLVRDERHSLPRQVLLRALEQRAAVVGDADIPDEPALVRLGEAVPVDLVLAVDDAWAAGRRAGTPPLSPEEEGSGVAGGRRGAGLHRTRGTAG